MKKTLILLALSLSLLACSSNDSSTEETSQSSKTVASFKASLNGKTFDYSQDNSTSPTHQFAYLSGYVSTGIQFEKSYYAGCALYPSASQTGYPQISLTFNGLYTNTNATTVSAAFYNSFKTIPTNFITLNEANTGKKGIDLSYQISDGTTYSTFYGSQIGSTLMVSSSIEGIEEGTNLKTQTLIGTISCKLYSETNPSDVIQLTDGQFKLIFREFN